MIASLAPLAQPVVFKEAASFSNFIFKKIERLCFFPRS
jgi:hypothetical protein